MLTILIVLQSRDERACKFVANMFANLFENFNRTQANNMCVLSYLLRREKICF